MSITFQKLISSEFCRDKLLAGMACLLWYFLFSYEKWVH